MTSSVTERDDRSIRDKILGRAGAARSFGEPGKRFSVKGLIKESFAPSDPFAAEPLPWCSEAEIFEKAYGNPLGPDYWDAWLFGAQSRAELADLMAAHCATNQDQFTRVKSTILGELTPQPQKSWREEVEWLIANPNTRTFVPDSLREFLDPQSPRKGTGAPGRPSSMHLVFAEHDRRCEANQAFLSVVEEAEYLQSWFASSHKNLSGTTAKTIENRIRNDHNKWKGKFPRK
ncbi:MAG: hypothetical protein WDN46_23235 [Methylocella sp.]